MSAVPPPPPASAAPAPNPGEAKNNLGVWSLALGIASIVCCLWVLAGVPAILLGMKSKQAAADGTATNGNLGQIGFILGIVGCVFGLIAAGWWILVFALDVVL